MILKNRVKISIVVILLIIIQYQIIDSIANQNIGNDFTALTSPPVITEVPEQTNFQWGQENASLSWEVLGGEMWELWKNDTQIRSGTVIDDNIEIKIENWQQDNWRLGTYNLTLQVSDENDTSTTSTIWLQIWKIFGDEYANSNVYSDSPWYYNEGNAFGAPDEKYAVIHYDYDAGALILDMGNGEEIIDENGNDLTIVAQGGNYSVKVTNDLSSPFTYLGFSKGNMSFDLADEELSSVRYVCVEYLDGSSVELDAVIAIHYNQPEKDLNPPQINGPSNFWVWSNKTTATLAWEAFDVTPWNYTILVDKIGFEKGPWNGSKIIFTLNLVGKNNVVNTTLVLYDLFGNRAKDTVILEIRPTTITTGITLSSTSSTTAEPTPLSFLTLFMGFGVLLIWHKYNTRRKKRA